MIGFIELLNAIRRQWDEDRDALLENADEIIAHLSRSAPSNAPDEDLSAKAVRQYERAFDRIHGGFGGAPKFPVPHNILYLLENYRRTRNHECADMASRTLMQMYRGGMFDHIGGGFSRYSTDEKWLVPHFEKMLYDNALLIMAYSRAHSVLEDRAEADLLLKVAERTADYVLREMSSLDGCFYSAQDADSEGEEGKYYVFRPEEIKEILPAHESDAFCRHFDISPGGNFKGRSIPNLLSSDPFDEQFEKYCEPVYRYRKQRHHLHLDNKILTAWNGLMISALCELYLESGERRWLDAARRANRFIKERLIVEGTLYASFVSGCLGAKAFLDDYAAYCHAQLALYRATLGEVYLNEAERLCAIALNDFYDEQNAGFFFSGKDNERLILRPKETYDGASPSGNSLMAWNLVRLLHLTDKEIYREHAQRQLDYLSREASAYPMGHGMFLCALQEFQEPPMKVIIVSPATTVSERFICALPSATILRLQKPSAEYPVLDGKTTFYICEGTACRPPITNIEQLTGAL